MLLSALTPSDTTQFQQFQLQLAHESSSPSGHQFIAPLAHSPIRPRLFWFVPAQPLSHGRPSFLDWREKEKNPPYSVLGNASPTSHL